VGSVTVYRKVKFFSESQEADDLSNKQSIK